MPGNSTNPPQDKPDPGSTDNPRIYSELCNSYRAIDDFRTKLLAALPLATGGLFLLLTDKAKIEDVQPLFAPIGVFGLITTLGLYFYELYGIKKCTHLIWAGRRLERELNVKNGQFKNRPEGVGNLINEPFAAGVIYPAVLAAWTFLVLAFTEKCMQPNPYAKFGAIGVFLAGFAVAFFYNLKLRWEDEERRTQEERE